MPRAGEYGPIEHGTVKGYRAEYRRGLTSCAACREARREYASARTRENRRKARPVTHEGDQTRVWRRNGLFEIDDTGVTSVAVCRMTRGSKGGPAVRDCNWRAITGSPEESMRLLNAHRIKAAHGAKGVHVARGDVLTPLVLSDEYRVGTPEHRLRTVAA